ncbi:hypothetical protein AKJ09_07592 [Labilithrix luteola]|uniref:Uncharacterized protein n=1 Tax=Labilithrix luteola TaxID=1391654 RepID=A0A0K1Q5D1_9BACT|nr:hypothetical protein AKJ09_07592 [Labilithrix luteola]
MGGHIAGPDGKVVPRPQIARVGHPIGRIGARTNAFARSTEDAGEAAREVTSRISARLGHGDRW